MATDTQQATTPRARRTAKSRRIAFRLTDELGTKLEHAVALSGRSQTDFITEAIADKADAIIQEQRILELTDRDMEALLAVLANPPAPNEAMLRSAARWRERGSPV
jgi:uncharacterized protein (DUF1778 family)